MNAQAAPVVPVSKAPPEARHYPVVGSLPDLVRLGATGFYEQAWRAHGDTFAVQLPSRHFVVVAHPDAVEHVLGSHRENYIKGPTYDAFRLLTGDGLLTLEGDAWRARRRMENPAFHRESIRRFVGTMAATTRDALTSMRWRIPNGGTVDIHHEIMRLTLEIAAETLFGQRLGEATGDASGRAFGEALELVSARGNSPLQIPLAVPTPANVRFRRVLQVLDEEVYRIIARARGAARDERPTLLGMLLDQRDAETGAALSDQDLRNEVLTLFLAGHETTALLLTWGFVLLAREPAVVAKMRAELASVLGDRDPSFEDVPKLTYLRQVVDEILRLRSPVWATARDAVNDDVIGGFRVRRGDVVMASMYLTHRHPGFWKDPERFDPERFTAESTRARHHWAYYPFSLGPRICIGNTFSLTESVVIFAMLLQRADFSMVAPEAIKAVAAITLRPSGPVPVKIRWRNPAH